MLAEDEREAIGIVVRGERMLPVAENSRPFPPDIRSWEVLLARVAGRQPSMRRPLAGPALPGLDRASAGSFRYRKE